MNVEKAIKRLQDNGHIMTNRRKDILMYFYNNDKYRTAKDLYDYMEKHYEGISFDTVYRNLHLFHELGILESTDLNAEKHFRMNCAEHHHHHFICDECGSTKKINFCPMDYLKSLLKNYEITDHKFEIYGKCPTCLA